MKRTLFFLPLFLISFLGLAQSKFESIDALIPTPNSVRTASGAPGHEYWQQQADYNINVTLDDEKQKISGYETVTYYNNSPDALSYIWFQLDQNLFDYKSDTWKMENHGVSQNKYPFNDLKKLFDNFEGGHKIQEVMDGSGTALKYTINKTMMRVDLPKAMAPKTKISFKIKWEYTISDRLKYDFRTGYEYFPEDNNYLYTIAQFYPRVCQYSDMEGWQNLQYTGKTEFALSFGNYNLSITVPADHVVGATGELRNGKEVLTTKQQELFIKARTATEPVIIVSQEEAINKKEKLKATKTWKFEARNVRDVAFATSRKFIWDAMGIQLGGKTVMCMSFYPKEGNPLWEKYSTRAVAHTIRTYSKYTIDYPYPVAQSVHSQDIGMEYPMISFNFGRPEKDGTYSERTKHRMVSVIMHEVGHNFFPMIINSDERKWAWQDEGFNSFFQYLTEQEWDRSFPPKRGEITTVIEYMSKPKETRVPIMTHANEIKEVGNTEYLKTAAGLNILRETIMGRELFDFAFKEYCKRWAFKHPTPADFFRTMEDASAVDLDWFWRGWFYGTDAVDISIDKMTKFRLDSKNPEIEKPLQKAEDQDKKRTISEIRNKESIKQSIVEADKGTDDFYKTYSAYEVTLADKEKFKKYLSTLTDEEIKLLSTKYNWYEIVFTNKGGLPMPLILEFEFNDGTKQMETLPVQVWALGDKTISKLFKFDKEVKRVKQDPYLQTSDIDTNNNSWPTEIGQNKFQLIKEVDYSRDDRGLENPMQKNK